MANKTYTYASNVMQFDESVSLDEVRRRFQAVFPELNSDSATFEETPNGGNFVLRVGTKGIQG